MARRVHTPALAVGQFALPPAQARHLRDVLRLSVGDAVDAFDDAGNTALATLVTINSQTVTVSVAHVSPPGARAFSWTIAAAVPKGQRSDWMIEKLTELGTTAFIPLVAERSVTIPEGKEKTARWSRLVAESAKQSGRPNVMKIFPLTPVRSVAESHPGAWVLSLAPDAKPILDLITAPPPPSLTMLIGPEGGWSPEELEMFSEHQLTSVKLAQTILRIETAALAAAALAAAWSARPSSFNIHNS